MTSLHQAALMGAIALAAAPAQAQQAPVPTGPVDPGRVQERLRPPAPERAAPELTAPEIPASVAPADAEKVRFAVSEVRVEGMSAFAPADMADLTAPYAGREISLAEAYRLADAVTARYRQKDYILSRAIVPAQRVENGVLRIQMVEGFVARIAFEGPHNARMARYADAITAEKPLRGQILERYLLLLNDLPGVTARAVLGPAEGVTGGSVVTIVVRKKPVDAYAGLDNHGSRYIGPVQYYAGVAVNDALGLGERLSLNYAGAAQTRELQYVSGGLDLPIGNDGLLLSVNGGYSNSRPGFALRDLDTHAQGTTFDARLSWPAIRGRAHTLRLGLSVHLLDSKTEMNGLPLVPPSSRDHVRAVRLGGVFDFADAAGGQNIVDLELSQGLDGLGALAENRPNPSRPNARNGFSKLTLELSRRQNLDSVAPGLGLFAVAKAQTSFGQALFSSEQFGLGGAAIGTAYDPSEITGDTGIAGRIELLYSLPARAVRGAVQFYGFYDAGTTHNVVAQFGEAQDRSLSSLGTGLRFSLLGHVSGYAELAKPLTRDIQTLVIAKEEARPVRLFFGLTLRP